MFMYVHASGQKPVGAFVAELAARFRALSPDDKEYNISPGRLASQQQREGQMSLWPRRRRRCAWCVLAARK